MSYCHDHGLPPSLNIEITSVFLSLAFPHLVALGVNCWLSCGVFIRFYEVKLEVKCFKLSDLHYIFFWGDENSSI